MIDATVLLIDDNKSIISALKILLQFEFKHISSISNPNQISTYPNLKDVDVVLLDMNFSAGVNTGNEGLFWLSKIKKAAPDASIIMMTAYGTVSLAVNALKNGATDFVLKPWNNEKLLITVKSAYSLRKSKFEIDQSKQKENSLNPIINQKQKLIIGNSKTLKHVLSLTRKVAKTDVNVLITGENGTGKDLIARELHRSSDRKNEVFIAVDMGTISETLFESELFGHVSGAFTDAKEDRVGKFEAANGGTLFLDEIGNLSLQMQSKLLFVIQNREIIKVGSNKSVQVDIRLLCATNCNLISMISDGLFREDLLYRINTIQIEVPSLRDREDDILVLSEFFLKKYTAKYGKRGLQTNSLAQEKLMKYHWPGNIRELDHAIERAVILSEQKILKPEDFLLNAPAPGILEYNSNTLKEMEELMISNSLKIHNGNYSAAANELGITRQTLYNKLRNK
jgi:DNA-binding NtrC family response regulator